MGDRVSRSGAGESGGEWWPSQRADLPEVHTSQRQQNSGNAVVARVGSPAERTVCGTSFTHTIEGGGRVMRKLIAVAMLVGGLLGMAGPATAQNPGGLADPLTLAASGVLIPFFGDPGDLAVLEISSPVGGNPNLHMFFFDANCDRVAESHFLPLTVNDIAFLQIVGDNSGPFGNPGVGVLDSLGFFGGGTGSTSGGLVAIASSNDGFALAPLPNPIHSRIFVFSPGTGRSRFIEPIILAAAESPSIEHDWSPLRTAATFFSPQEGFTFSNGSVLTNTLYLICPEATIVQPPYFSPTFDPVTGGGNFPPIVPAFPGGAANFNPFSSSTANGSLRAIIFDTDENPLVDIHTTCACVRTVDPITQLHSIYGSALAINGTYTKIESNSLASSLTVGGGPPNQLFAFTGYKSARASDHNDFFGRLYTGSYLAIDANVPTGATPNQR